MTPKEERTMIHAILAKNRYAKCPDGINKKRFAGIRAAMEKIFLAQYMATPEGLYTDAQIWAQTFND
jgi:hypothetical protein